MFWTLVIFLPVWTCLFWMIAHSISGYRQDTYPMVMVLLLFTGLTLFNDSCYSDGRTPTDLFIVSNVIAQFAAPCMIPMVGLYLRRLRTNERPHPFQMLWLLAPAALFTSEVIMHLLAKPGEIHGFLQELYHGTPDIESFKGTIAYAHYLSTVVIFRGVIILEMIGLLIFQIIDAIDSKSKFRHTINFWTGGSIRLKGLQTFNLSLIYVLFLIKLLLLRSYINSHPWTMALMAVLMSVAISMFCHAAMFSQRKSLTLRDLFNGWRYNYNHNTRNAAIAEMLDELVHEADEDTLAHLRHKLAVYGAAGNRPANAQASPVFNSRIINMAGGSLDADSLRARFQRLMLEEKLFLQPRLSLGDVAKRLHSNTTYVSKLVNDTYDLGFPELVNTMRVDYAQQYLRKHRQAKQTQIAADCGFLSASAFNNTFKRISGMTPKMWMASHREAEK